MKSGLIKNFFLIGLLFFVSFKASISKDTSNKTLGKYQQILIDYFLHDKEDANINQAVNYMQAYYNLKAPYEALSFYNELLKNEKSISSEEKKVFLYKSIGFQYKLLGKYELAAKYFYFAKDAAEKRQDFNASAWCNVDIGNLYYDYNQFDEALNHYKKAIITFEIIASDTKKSKEQIVDAKLGIAVSNENIGLSMIGLQKYDSAIYYIKKNEKIRLGPDLPYINQQYYYLLLASTYFVMKKYDSVFTYANLSLSVRPSPNLQDPFPEYNKFRSNAQTFLGMYYIIKNQPKLGHQYFKSSLKTAEAFQSKVFLIKNYIGIIQFLLSQNMAGEAYNYLRLAKLVTQNSPAFNDENYNLMLTTADVYTKLNQIEKAKKVQDTIILYLDSLNKKISAQNLKTAKLDLELQNNLQRIERLNMEKEYQSKQLSNQSIIMWLLIGLAVILAILFSFIYYVYVQRNKLNKKLALQNKELNVLNSRLNESLELTEQMNLELVASQEKLTQINQNLEEANNTKNTLFSIVAHNLKNAIGGVSNMSKMIVDDIDEFSKNELYTFMNLINDTINQMYKLMESLLLWSSSQRGTIKATKELNYPSYVVDNTINLYKQAADEKNINIINEIPKDLAFVFDASLLDTIIRNLVNNSIKFSNIGGEIKISCSIQDKEVLFCVCDNGVGMPQEKADKIFNIDKNKSTTGTKGEKGTGLGLMVCYDFVKMHNGRIWFESQVGKGTKAFFTFEYIEHTEEEEKQEV